MLLAQARRKKSPSKPDAKERRAKESAFGRSRADCPWDLIEDGEIEGHENAFYREETWLYSMS